MGSLNNFRITIAGEVYNKIAHSSRYCVYSLCTMKVDRKARMLGVRDDINIQLKEVFNVQT